MVLHAYQASTHTYGDACCGRRYGVQAALLEALDVEEQWDKTAVARRVQHFG